MLAQPDSTDETLMQDMQNADSSAFAILVERHHRRFYRLAYRQLLDPADAEDVVQDCFITLWQKSKTFQAEKGIRFTSWFSRIVLNRAADHRRGQSRRKARQAVALHHSAETTEDLKEDTQQQALHHALGALPERQRMAVNLCFYENHSNQQAAEIIGTSRKALEALLMRAKAHLKKTLEKSNAQP